MILCSFVGTWYPVQYSYEDYNSFFLKLFIFLEIILEMTLLILICIFPEIKHRGSGILKHFLCCSMSIPFRN